MVLLSEVKCDESTMSFFLIGYAIMNVSFEQFCQLGLRCSSHVAIAYGIVARQDMANGSFAAPFPFLKYNTL